MAKSTPMHIITKCQLACIVMGLVILAALFIHNQ